MNGVAIVALNHVSQDLVADAQHCLRQELALRSSLARSTIDPEFAFDAKRKQYNSTLLLRRVVERPPAGAQRVLALVEGDLFIPMLSFVYGQAQVDGLGALVSATRLRQEFYGLPADPGLLSTRFRKEVLHEMGHTLSLVHCNDAVCVMSLATNVRQVDAKAETFCGSCRRVLQERARLLAPTSMENNA
jgi:archaemetzincin